MQRRGRRRPSTTLMRCLVLRTQQFGRGVRRQRLPFEWLTAAQVERRGRLSNGALQEAASMVGLAVTTRSPSSKGQAAVIGRSRSGALADMPRSASHRGGAERRRGEPTDLVSTSPVRFGGELIRVGFEHRRTHRCHGSGCAQWAGRGRATALRSPSLATLRSMVEQPRRAVRAPQRALPLLHRSGHFLRARDCRRPRRHPSGPHGPCPYPSCRGDVRLVPGQLGAPANLRWKPARLPPVERRQLVGKLTQRPDLPC